MDTDLEKLRQALVTLPERERQAFERARIGGLSYSAIASELGIDIAEVERLMGNAISHLADVIDPKH